MTTRTSKAVIVTTSHRGVFFGYAAGKTSGSTVRLTRARNCLYWSADVKGFMGLAANGPSATCRIGPAADIELRDVTAVLDVAPEAVTKWEQAPWVS